MAKSIQSTCPDTLLERLKDGDDVAFGELVNENWDKIYNRANSLLDNRQDAEEVAQDTFIRARKNIGNFRGDCAITTWLYHIATNLAHNKHWYWWRRKRGQSISLDTPLGDEGDMTVCDTIASESQDPADSAVSSELAELLPRAIDALPPKYGEVLKLRNSEDLSYEEIAERLHLSVGTIKSRLSRAREYLREELERLRA